MTCPEIIITTEYITRNIEIPICSVTLSTEQVREIILNQYPDIPKYCKLDFNIKQDGDYEAICNDIMLKWEGI